MGMCEVKSRAWIPKKGFVPGVFPCRTVQFRRVLATGQADETIGTWVVVGLGEPISNTVQIRKQNRFIFGRFNSGALLDVVGMTHCDDYFTPGVSFF